MKTYDVKIKGIAGLLQNKIPDDLDVQAKKGEGKDTPEAAEKKLYIVDGKICQPAIHIEKAMVKTATGIKQKGAGRKSYKDLFRGSVFVRPEMVPHLSQKWEVHRDTVVIPSTRGRIVRYRPILRDWSLAFTIEVLDDRITDEVVKMALDEAGRTNGLGDNRPRFGRFIVERFRKK